MNHHTGSVTSTELVGVQEDTVLNRAQCFYSYVLLNFIVTETHHATIYFLLETHTFTLNAYTVTARVSLYDLLY